MTNLAAGDTSVGSTPRSGSSAAYSSFPPCTALEELLYALRTQRFSELMALLEIFPQMPRPVDVIDHLLVVDSCHLPTKRTDLRQLVN